MIPRYELVGWSDQPEPTDDPPKDGQWVRYEDYKAEFEEAAQMCSHLLFDDHVQDSELTWLAKWMPPDHVDRVVKRRILIKEQQMTPLEQKLVALKSEAIGVLMNAFSGTDIKEEVLRAAISVLESELRP